MRDALIHEIKILRLGIQTAEKMIGTYMNYFNDNPDKYQAKIIKKYEQINKYNKLIGVIRLKLIKMGFKK